MGQPSSRGSPRPRGHIHQISYSFHFLIINKILTKSQLMHGQFTLPQDSSQRASCNETVSFPCNQLINGFSSPHCSLQFYQLSVSQAIFSQGFYKEKHIADHTGSYGLKRDHYLNIPIYA